MTIACRSPRPDARTPGPARTPPRPLQRAARRARRAAAGIVLALGLAGIAAPPASAEVVANWGAVITPVVEQATFNFSRTGISQNFTDDYLFSLQGSSGATYSVTFDLSGCARGCGNAALTYGIYDANGGLVADASSGSVTLAAGSYSLQVKGTGMGAGNNIGYDGTVTFSAAAAGTVSAAPEPSTYLLTLIGLTLVGWVGHRNAGSRSSAGGGRFAPVAAAGPRAAA
jgi:hypothetical protein